MEEEKDLELDQNLDPILEEEGEEKGLGDVVEDFIKAVVPKLAEKYKDCPSCKKRKEWLNNYNATIK